MVMHFIINSMVANEMWDLGGVVRAWMLTAVSHTNNGSFLINYLFSLELQVFIILEAITSCQVYLNWQIILNIIVGVQTERET